jgi:hypothetical protein
MCDCAKKSFKPWSYPTAAHQPIAPTQQAPVYQPVPQAAPTGNPQQMSVQSTGHSSSRSSSSRRHHSKSSKKSHGSGRKDRHHRN